MAQEVSAAEADSLFPGMHQLPRDKSGVYGVALVVVTASMSKIGWRSHR